MKVVPFQVPIYKMYLNHNFDSVFFLLRIVFKNRVLKINNFSLRTSKKLLRYKG